MPIFIPGYYYAMQGADPSLEYPAEGYGGWDRTQVPIDLRRTAVIVMHAWRILEYEAHIRHLEYLARANEIIKNRFPSFLQAVRKSQMKLIHVAAGFETCLSDYPGYTRMMEKFPPVHRQIIERSTQMEQLCAKHWNLVGADRDIYASQIENGFAEYDLAIKPLDSEDIVIAEDQLFSLCHEQGIEHLIYTGFAVNACLMNASCGMVDMNRRGLMCSVVGDLTTAVENKETCRTQENLKHGLWKFATSRGFVFLSKDLQNALT